MLGKFKKTKDVAEFSVEFHLLRCWITPASALCRDRYLDKLFNQYLFNRLFYYILILKIKVKNC